MFHSIFISFFLLLFISCAVGNDWCLTRNYVEGNPPPDTNGNGLADMCDSGCFPLVISGVYFPDTTWQSANLINNKLYLVKSNLGGIVELNNDLDAVWEANLTQNGISLSDHPVNIAYKKGYSTIIGALQKIMVIDWNIFLEEANLDNALISQITDMHTEGFDRVAYVEKNGQTYLAIAGYSLEPIVDFSTGNVIRLYDPNFINSASTTDDPDFLVFEMDAPQFIQSCFWDEEEQKLVLVRNESDQQGLIVDQFDLETQAVTSSICYETEMEIEGYTTLDDGTQLFVTGERDGFIFVQEPQITEESFLRTFSQKEALYE